jgi:SAM-dependent methyltransferase
LDAPGVVRKLVVCAGIGALLWVSTMARLWSGVVTIGPAAFPLGTMGIISFVLCGGMAAWMVWESKVGKLRERDRLLNLVPWTGREQVLDVGCGRGLMLIGAARRVPDGRATGIDIWRAEDLSGNSAEGTLANAKLEGVAERVEVQTADMRKIPFPDQSFDVIVSSNAIHNLYRAPDRAASLTEIVRVLKPGGWVLIIDIRHFREYARLLEEHGYVEVRRARSVFAAGALAMLTFGSLRPAVLVGRRPQAP